MKQEDYIKLLIKSKHYPTRYSYGIAYDFEKPDSGIEQVVEYEIGFNAYVDNNIKIISTASRSALMSVDILGIPYEFRVFAPLNISPDEFYHRVNYAISKRFFGLSTGDEGFAILKSEYVKQKAKAMSGVRIKLNQI